MEHKGIVNGVNMAGRVQPSEDPCQVRVARQPSAFKVGMMRVLNAFGNFISPIKEEKRRK